MNKHCKYYLLIFIYKDKTEYQVRLIERHTTLKVACPSKDAADNLMQVLHDCGWERMEDQTVSF